MKRPNDILSSLRSALLLAALFLSASAYGDTMDVLLDGFDLRLEYTGGGAIRITFNADGSYVTNTGSSGTWTLEDEQLCTVRDADGAMSCGELPDDKVGNDSWSSTDGNGNPVTASLVPQS